MAWSRGKKKTAPPPFDGKRADIPRYHLNLFLPSQGGTSSGTWGERSRGGCSCRPVYADLVCLIAVTGDPVDPLASLPSEFCFETTAPGMYSTEASPPSCTIRRLSVRAAAVYLFPLIAFDGDIINPCKEFVKGFGEFIRKNFSWLENMQICGRICKGIPSRRKQIWVYRTAINPSDMCHTARDMHLRCVIFRFAE